MSNPQVLASTLSAVTPGEYVRFVADWMTDADQLGEPAALTGVGAIDALVAAAAAEVAHRRGAAPPAWTEDKTRVCTPVWYLGPDSLLPNALVHAPLSFVLHGVLVEAESLISV